MPIGFSFGAVASAGGLDPAIPIAFSLLVFAGGSQFAALSVLLAGGGLVAATISALVLNSRLMPFGFAIADVFSESRWARLLGVHLITDASAALTMQATGSDRRRTIYWTSGTAIFVIWNLSTAAGAFIGRALGDVDAYGLDAALPLVLVGSLVPALRQPRLRVRALFGAALAVATSPLLPAGYPILLALLGLFVGGRSVPPAVAPDAPNAPNAQ